MTRTNLIQLRASFTIFPAIFVAGVIAAASHAADDLKLWYDKPAANWEQQALPIGNGRLGAMIFGGGLEEHIQFNEASLWIGDEQDTGAYQNFGDVFVTFHHGPVSNYRRALNISRAVHAVDYKSDGIAFHREAFASSPAGVMIFHFSADKPGSLSGSVRLADATTAVLRPQVIAWSPAEISPATSTKAIGRTTLS